MDYKKILFLLEKTSKKEQHRIDKFLKEHNYDPKTKTIEIDEKDKNGRKKRVKFDISNGPAFSDQTSTDPNNPSIETSKITMSRKTLKRKPMISHGVFKHEEGHVIDNTDSKRFKELHDKANKAINADEANEKNDHDNKSKEYVADTYSATHSKFGLNGFNKMINATRANDNDVKKRLEKIKKMYKSGKNVSGGEVDVLRSKIRVCKKRLQTLRQLSEKEINKLVEELKFSKDVEEKEVIKEELKFRRSYDGKKITELQTEIKGLEVQLNTLIKQVFPDEYVDKGIEDKKDAIMADIKNNNKTLNNGAELRRKFVNDNVKESVNDIKLQIYEACYNGLITENEQHILLKRLRNKISK